MEDGGTKGANESEEHEDQIITRDSSEPTHEHWAHCCDRCQGCIRDANVARTIRGWAEGKDQGKSGELKSGL